MINYEDLKNVQKDILKNVKGLTDALNKIDDKDVKPMKESIEVLNSCLADMKNPNNLEKLYAQNQKMINLMQTKFNKK